MTGNYGGAMFKILIVDDESIEREGIIYLIDRYQLPLEVVQATNGKAAFDYMQENSIDILLTDIKMPLMDGLELAQRTFETYPDVRILIFSAYGEFEYAKKAMAAHVINYLLKPIEVEEFEQVMRQLISQCSELEETRRIAQRDEEERQRRLFHVTEDIRQSRTGAASIPASQPADSSTIVRRVHQIVEKEYGQPLSLEYLATRVYITPSYLSYIYKQATGQNLLKYITDLRMDKARAMMSDASLKISQIARYCGYDNPSYFNKLFKNYYGITPRQYREGVHSEGTV